MATIRLVTILHEKWNEKLRFKMKPHTHNRQTDRQTMRAPIWSRNFAELELGSKEAQAETNRVRLNCSHVHGKMHWMHYRYSDFSIVFSFFYTYCSLLFIYSLCLYMFSLHFARHWFLECVLFWLASSSVSKTVNHSSRHEQNEKKINIQFGCAKQIRTYKQKKYTQTISLLYK